MTRVEVGEAPGTPCVVVRITTEILQLRYHVLGKLEALGTPDHGTQESGHSVPSTAETCLKDAKRQTLAKTPMFFFFDLRSGF